MESYFYFVQKSKGYPETCLSRTQLDIPQAVDGACCLISQEIQRTVIGNNNSGNTYLLQVGKDLGTNKF